MAVDFYLRLGVGRKADADSIKRAYRKIAKSCHPDVDGNCGDAGRFHEVQEAYETLSDTKKRRKYDERLEREKEATSVHGSRRGGGIPESMAGSSDPGGRYGEAIHPDPFSAFGGLDAAFSNPRAEYFDAVLSPREARNGVSCRLPVHISFRCPWCAYAFPGAPQRGLLCSACGGVGTILKRRDLSLHLPPGIENGSVLTLNVLSLPETQVKVRIIIGG